MENRIDAALSNADTQAVLDALGKFDAPAFANKKARR